MPIQRNSYGPTLGPAMALPLTVQSGLAILRIDTPLMMGGWFGCEPEQVCEAIDRAAMDQALRVLLLDFHCPGGTAFGTSDLEAAAKRFKATGKRLCAIAHDQCCSSAYWLASYADEITATHSAMVGSIGTIQTIYDDSQRFQTEGVRPVVIEMPGVHKRVGIPGVPITAEHEARLRTSLAIHQANFRNAVATNRGMTPEAVDALGGAALMASEALTAGLIDRVVDFRSYVAELTNQAVNGPAPSSAENVARIHTEPHMAKNETPISTPVALNMSEEEIRQKYPDVVSAIEAKAKAGAKAEAAPAEEEEDMPPPAEEKAENKAPAPAVNAAPRAATMDELKLIAPSDPQFVLDCLESGATLPVARKMFERISATNKAPEPKPAAPAPGRGVTQPVPLRSAKAQNVEGVGSFLDAVAHVMKRDNCKRGQATRTAAREFRDLHTAYVTNLRENPVTVMEEGGSQRVSAADLRTV